MFKPRYRAERVLTCEFAVQLGGSILHAGPENSAGAQHALNLTEMENHMSRPRRKKSAADLAQEQWGLIDALAESNVKRMQNRDYDNLYCDEHSRLMAVAEKHFRSVLGEASSSASASAGA